MKAIILCGGLGTRLGELTQHTPKPLINVAGRPFLAYVMDKLSTADIDGFVLATGYHAVKVSDIIKSTWQDRSVQYSIEDRPLGTGGAVRLAMENFNLDSALVANGDTLFDCDLHSMMNGFEGSPWATRLALRQMENCKRYGRVQLSKDTRVIGFGEKGHAGSGLINAGLFLQRRSALDSFGNQPFSFETDYLAKLDPVWPIQGVVEEGYFVDMGIPEDLEQARKDLMNR